MMRFELGLEEPDPKRAHRSAMTIAASYVAGGIIPLSPYMLMHSARAALEWSVIVTLIALGVFGYIKGASPGPAASLRPTNRCNRRTCRLRGFPAGQAHLLTQYGKKIYADFY